MPDVEKRWPEVKTALEERGIKPFAISAIAGMGIRPVLYKAAQCLADAPPLPAIEATPIYRVEIDPNEFGIERLADSQGWRVTGAAIERAAAMTYWEYDQSIRRFQRILETLGIEQALRDAGVQAGDSVFIGDNELDWQD